MNRGSHSSFLPVQLVRKFLKFSPELREVDVYYLPYHIRINLKILMHEDVAHSNYL